MNTSLATFDIRNFTERLTKTSEKNRYICPVCKGNNLTIDPKDGAYQCWNECQCRDIREEVAPWDEVKGSQPRQRRQRPAQPKTPTPAPIPDAPIELAIFPNPVESPTKVKKGNKTEIIYPYSDTQWVQRVEKSDGSKKTYPYHINSKGSEEIGKGDATWTPYRMDEISTHGKGKWVLCVEGEKCVEIARQLGLINFTLQGASWGEDDLIQAMQLIKDAGVPGVVDFPDHDTTGYSKAQKMASAAALVQLPFIQIDPLQLWSECPEKGDIADWVEWGKVQGMEVPDFIKQLEKEIHRAVEEKSKHVIQQKSDDRQDIPDSLKPNVTFNQQAFNFLYGDKPWISADGKLYYWTGNHYKYSPDAVERNRITAFCNTFPVVDKEGNVTYPYAKPAKANEVLLWAKYMREVNPELLNPPGLNCTNGVLQTKFQGSKPGWQLMPHDPALYYIYEPIVTYDPGADPTDCNRLLEVLDKPQREIFLRTIAASLDMATVRKFKGRLVRGLLLKGDGNNGKDSLREVVSMMYGRLGMTGCTLSDFKAYDEGRKFPLSRLKNSRVNWATENTNTAALDKLQSIKAFITGDTLSAEGKGKDEFDYNPSGVALFNVNDTPNIKATLEAIASRWGILDFIKTFKIGADPALGEIEADPRFKYDPEFLRNQILPAFLNRVLQALVDLMQHGIDYSCTEKVLHEIQRKNSHLFEFCQDVGLSDDPNSTMLASDIWNLLEQWYQDNGTLSYEEGSNGKRKAIWNEQPRKADNNVKAVNQVIARFSVLFPKAKVVAVAKEGGGKPRVGLQGIGVTQISLNVTQSSPNTSPNDALLDKAFHPSHPISPTSEKENQKVDHSPTYPYETSLQSSDPPPNLGELGENVDTASTLGCSSGCKLGEVPSKLGDERGFNTQPVTVTSNPEHELTVGDESENLPTEEREILVGDRVEWAGDSFDVAAGCVGEVIGEVFGDSKVCWTRPDGSSFVRRDSADGLRSIGHSFH